MANSQTDGATAGTPPGAAPQAGQQLVIAAQYIKDLSFENPRAPHPPGG